MGLLASERSKRYKVLRQGISLSDADALNVSASALGFGVLVVDTFKDNQVVFLTDKQHKEATEKGEVE